VNTQRHILPAILLGAFAAAPASAQPLAIDWHSIDAGGGVSSGGDFVLRGAIGQHDAGAAAAGDLTLHAGFLAGAGPQSCTADCDGDGQLNILDFVCFQQSFGSQDPVADCNGDGQFNILDFVCYQQLFNDGCE